MNFQIFVKLLGSGLNSTIFQTSKNIRSIPVVFTVLLIAMSFTSGFAQAQKFWMQNIGHIPAMTADAQLTIPLHQSLHHFLCLQIRNR